MTVILVLGRLKQVQLVHSLSVIQQDCLKHNKASSLALKDEMLAVHWVMWIDNIPGRQEEDTPVSLPPQSSAAVHPLTYS